MGELNILSWGTNVSSIYVTGDFIVNCIFTGLSIHIPQLSILNCSVSLKRFPVVNIDSVSNQIVVYIQQMSF